MPVTSAFYAVEGWGVRLSEHAYRRTAAGLSPLASDSSAFANHSLAIERRDYDVFSSRVRLSAWHKMALAVQALPVRWGWVCSAC